VAADERFVADAVFFFAGPRPVDALPARPFWAFAVADLPAGFLSPAVRFAAGLFRRTFEAVFLAADFAAALLARFAAFGAADRALDFDFAATARDTFFTPLDEPDFFVFVREAALPVLLALRLAIVRVLSATLTVCGKFRKLYCLSEIRRRC
jgi:hypothetical protein